MIEKTENTRHSLAILALMAMFVAGLIAANYLVKTRSQIKLSDPIILPQVGLKISMPEGPNWSHTPWQPGNNAFALLAIFKPDPSRPQIQVLAILRPTPLDIGPVDIINQKAQQLRAEEFEVKSTKINDYMAYSVVISSRTTPYAVAFAILTLDDKLQLDIEVLDTTGDRLHAADILDKILHSVELESMEIQPNGEQL